MKIWQGFQVALRALRGNTLRSVLTMLGIIVGVGSVISTVGVSEGAHKEVLNQLKAIGSNLMMVQSGAAKKGIARLEVGTLQSLTEDDAAAISAEIPGVLIAAPLVLGQTQIVRKNNNWNTWTRGTVPDFFLAREWPTVLGEHFTGQDVKSGAKVAVIGKIVADTLFAFENPVGKIIRIERVPFTVIGVLKEKGRNEDDAIFVPITTAKVRLFSEKHRIDRGSVQYVLVKMAETESMIEAENQVRSLLRQRHNLPHEVDDDFKISNWAASMAAKIETSNTLSILLATVASISLIVGGISIMNIMLVSVTERTREIGVRLAVGARPRDIQIQFLIESVTLCFFGGGAGVIVGIVASALIAWTAGWTILIGPGAIGLALGFAVAVGILFGYYPARRASRLDPIAALQVG